MIILLLRKENHGELTTPFSISPVKECFEAFDKKKAVVLH